MRESSSSKVAGKSWEYIFIVFIPNECRNMMGQLFRRQFKSLGHSIMSIYFNVLLFLSSCFLMLDNNMIDNANLNGKTHIYIYI